MMIDPKKPSEWPNPEVPTEDPDALFDEDYGGFDSQEFDYDDIPDVDDWGNDDES